MICNLEKVCPVRRGLWYVTFWIVLSIDGDRREWACFFGLGTQSIDSFGKPVYQDPASKSNPKSPFSAHKMKICSQFCLLTRGIYILYVLSNTGFAMDSTKASCSSKIRVIIYTSFKYINLT